MKIAQTSNLMASPLVTQHWHSIRPLCFFILLTAFILVSNVNMQAQIRIHTNSQVKAKGQLSTNVSFINSSTNTNLNEAKISLAGSNQQISTNQQIVVANVALNSSSVIIVNGNWQITNTLSLTNGILKVVDGARLLYSGNAVVEGNDASYVEGYFTQSGTGRKFFPIGAGGFYLPAILEDVPPGANEVSMRVVSGDAQFQMPSGISSFVTSHYWQLSPSVTSPVSLSLLEAGSGGEYFVVLEAGSVGGTANFVIGSVSNDFISTSDNVTQTLFAIGKRAEFSVIIHDMITPFIKDNINDRLTIENIEKTISNKVTLLDRWGTKVNEWENYTNELEYDFSALSPGNYVCIVDFTSPDGRTGIQNGIVTVLKTK